MQKLNEIDPDLREAIWHALRRAGVTSLDRCVGSHRHPMAASVWPPRRILKSLCRNPPTIEFRQHRRRLSGQ